MFLFLLLGTIIFVAVSLAVLVVGAIGGAFVFVFGDVIVCVLLIALIIKYLFDKRR